MHAAWSSQAEQQHGRRWPNVPGNDDTAPQLLVPAIALDVAPVLVHNRVSGEDERATFEVHMAHLFSTVARIMEFGPPFYASWLEGMATVNRAVATSPRLVRQQLTFPAVIRPEGVASNSVLARHVRVIEFPILAPCSSMT